LILRRSQRLAIGAALVAIAVIIGVLVTLVGEPPFDLPAVEHAREWRDGAVGALMDAASDVGYAAWLVPVTVVVSLVFAFVLGRAREALLVLSATAISSLATRLLKETFERTRPDGAHELVAGFSMPSGHAGSSAAFAMSIALAVHGMRLALPVRIALATFALVVGVSRVVLGVHYPSDVLAGWCLGCGIALLLSVPVLAGDDRAHAHPTR